MKELKAAAIYFAEGAGNILRRYYHSSITISEKGPNDLVTNADRESEQFIIENIQKEFSDHAILGEESGHFKKNGPYRWVIDPLDGTTNFAHKWPHFCVLIAVQQETSADNYQTIVGVTLDPLRNELFVAEKDAGSFLNDSKITVSPIRSLFSSIVTTGFAYKRLWQENDNHREFCRMNLVTQGARRAGSAGLDLAYIACGRAEAFWEYALNPWDVAPGVLLVQEARGMVSNLDGEAFDVSQGHIVASNGHVHQATLDALQSCRELPANSRAGIGVHLPQEISNKLQNSLI